MHEITRSKGRYVETGFKLDIQAKSTVNAAFEAEQLKYDLEVKNYDDLRDADVGTPRILVLLVMPEQEDQWTTMDEEQLLLRRCAYWRSLKGEGPTSNKETIRVSIPRANAFSIEQLKTLMGKVREGQDL